MIHIVQGSNHFLKVGFLELEWLTSVGKCDSYDLKHGNPFQKIQITDQI